MFESLRAPVNRDKTAQSAEDQNRLLTKAADRATFRFASLDLGQGPTKSELNPRQQLAINLGTKSIREIYHFNGKEFTVTPDVQAMAKSGKITGTLTSQDGSTISFTYLPTDPQANRRFALQDPKTGEFVPVVEPTRALSLFRQLAGSSAESRTGSAA